MIRLACVLLVFTVVLLRVTSGPTQESLTPSVSSRIATHCDDPIYEVLAEQHNRSIEINSQFRKLKDDRQYSKIIELARTRRAELDRVISKVYGMGLVAQERDRLLTPMREEQNQIPRIIAAANELR
jgi:hypothetical protein